MKNTVKEIVDRVLDLKPNKALTLETVNGCKYMVQCLEEPIVQLSISIVSFRVPEVEARDCKSIIYFSRKAVDILGVDVFPFILLHEIGHYEGNAFISPGSQCLGIEAEVKADMFSAKALDLSREEACAILDRISAYVERYAPLALVNADDSVREEFFSTFNREMKVRYKSFQTHLQSSNAA